MRQYMPPGSPESDALDELADVCGDVLSFTDHEEPISEAAYALARLIRVFLTETLPMKAVILDTLPRRGLLQRRSVCPTNIQMLAPLPISILQYQGSTVPTVFVE